MKSVEDGGIGRAGVVIACSALKKWYRDILRGDVDAIPPPVDDLVRVSVSFPN
jgi:gluconokinase